MQRLAKQGECPVPQDGQTVEDVVTAAEIDEGVRIAFQDFAGKLATPAPATK
jgi:hypothetical protein